MNKKKEKPIKEYSIVEICSKAIYTQVFSYMPTKITYYETWVEFCIDRIEAQTQNLLSFTVSVPLTDARFLPFEIEDESLLWDTKDMALRIKRLPAGEAKALIFGVDFYPNEVMTMTREFAEKYLSPSARSYATLLEDKYVWYYADGSAAPVVFEIPRLFTIFEQLEDHPLDARFESVTSQLFTFTPGYVEDMGLDSENVRRQYTENKKKGASGEQ